MNCSCSAVAQGGPGTTWVLEEAGPSTDSAHAFCEERTRKEWLFNICKWPEEGQPVQVHQVCRWHQTGGQTYRLFPVWGQPSEAVVGSAVRDGPRRGSSCHPPSCTARGSRGDGATATRRARQWTGDWGTHQSWSSWGWTWGENFYPRPAEWNLERLWDLCSWRFLRDIRAKP